MARILLGWELGAGRGHAVKLARLATALREAGHEPIAAVQAISAMPAEIEAWQAPLWPGMIAPLARPAAALPATMGDILAILGLSDAEAMRAMIAAWDKMLVAFRPDAVCAEFAPALMLAARGRIPVVALGTGFSLPPPRLPAFPSLTGKPAAWNERGLLAGLNRALAANGREPLDRLPALFVADRTIAAVFAEFDPYRSSRVEPQGAPSLSAAVPFSDAKGEEVFVYLSGVRAQPRALWQGLSASGLKVRVCDPALGHAEAEALEQAGLTIERCPVPIARIVERSRLLVSFGGMGLVTSALLAGLPQIVLPHDIEKALTGTALEITGLGRSLPLDALDAAGFAAMLCACFEDEPLADRVRAVAPGFAARAARSAEEETLAALAGLVG